MSLKLIFHIFWICVIINYYVIANNNSDDNNEKYCNELCLANTKLRSPNSNNIDIYLEYKKAFINVDVPIKNNNKIKESQVLSSGTQISNLMQRSKIFRKRHIIENRTNEVSSRNFHVEPEKEKCNAKNMIKSLKKIKCRPRPTILGVISTLGTISPNKVLVRQCSGSCDTNKICLPVKTRNVTTSVIITGPDGKTECSTIQVTEDVKCRCKEQCNSKQIFDSQNGSCSCKNKKKETDCIHKMSMMPGINYWDKLKCSCRCIKQNTSCTTGFFWDETNCRCTKKSANG